MTKPESIKMDKDNGILTDAQLQNELQKCEFCREKPCKTACPCAVSPPDFIMAARQFTNSDLQRSSALILEQNPLGGICGMVCPDRLCMAACVHERMDEAVKIPAVQATIIAKARAAGAEPQFKKAKANGKKVAIIGAGPAGLAAAAVLGQLGYRVDILEYDENAGGMCRTIPEHRLFPKILRDDLDFIFSLKNISWRGSQELKDTSSLLKKNYNAIIVATGLWEPLTTGIPGEEVTIPGIYYLNKLSSYRLKGRVAVIGGGATALDCAIAAKIRGADYVEMFALENLGEMPLTKKESEEISTFGIDLSCRTRVTAIHTKGKKVIGLDTIKIELPAGKSFNFKDIKEVANSEQKRTDINHVIVAIGARSNFKTTKNRKIFFAGDVINGPTTVVEAVAAGKNVAAQVDVFLRSRKVMKVVDPVNSEIAMAGYEHEPVSLETDFFGRKISSPFLLSASPATDGYEQMKLAYEAGWPGGIIKTAFDGVPVHIPAAYMTCYTDTTWGNCDNVSDHPISRVCRELRRLNKEYPDRINGASTGGNVSGNDQEDKKSWQSNTRKLEKAGASLIEYSLSCPQGGEGAEGDIVSQNGPLTAKIINWVLEKGDPNVPKLFKLTSAVTDVCTILRHVKEVFAKYPQAKVGVTLANSFPSLTFNPGQKKEWEDGVVAGISGEGITPVSYLCLANAGGMNVTISGNAGPMNYRAAADFLALGTSTVQFCTIVEKYGYEIIDDLKSGLSHLMAERGIKSVKQLIGIAQPNPIRDFMDLDAVKQISSCDQDLCVQCGNCSRCPYLAIKMNKETYPEIDASLCIGCKLCVLQCPTNALTLRNRTPQEKAIMSH